MNLHSQGISSQARLNHQYFAQPLKNLISVLTISLGCMAIALALVSWFTNMQVGDIMAWLEQYFGMSFIMFYLCLCCSAIYCVYKIAHCQHMTFFYQLGMHAANGVSTLALTYTLLGISLGIGTLSNQHLSPENVNEIISQLTAQFSIAFMTTVLGLPSAAILRALLGLTLVRQQTKDNKANEG